MRKPQFVQEWVIRHGKHAPEDVKRHAAEGASVFELLVAMGYADLPEAAPPPVAQPVLSYRQPAVQEWDGDPKTPISCRPFKANLSLTPVQKHEMLLSDLRHFTALYQTAPTIWWFALNDVRSKLGLPALEPPADPPPQQAEPVQQSAETPAA